VTDLRCARAAPRALPRFGRVGRTAGLLAAWLLAACALAPRVPGEWTSGRLSVNVGATPERPAQNFSAAFELRGDGAHGELRLSTPLGAQIARARWAPGEAVLDTGDGERSYASADELGLQALGERVPLDALPDWVAGHPWAGAPSQLREHGFEQLGWSIDLSRRADGRLVARREQPPAVTVRIVLDASQG
jgi:outer membrane lipoprotein LolB